MCVILYPVEVKDEKLATKNCLWNPDECLFAGVSTNWTHPYFKPSYDKPLEVKNVSFQYSDMHIVD